MSVANEHVIGTQLDNIDLDNMFFHQILYLELCNTHIRLLKLNEDE